MRATQDINEQLADIRAAQAGDLDARNRLAAANLPLIGAAILSALPPPSRKDPYATVQEHMSIGFVGFCRALRTFDPDRGKFSTYLYRAVRDAIYTEFRILHGDLRSPKRRAMSATVSLQYCPANHARLRRLRPDESKPQIVDTLTLCAYIERLDCRSAAIIYSRLLGIKQRELADQYRLSNQRICQIEQKARRQLRAWMEADGVAA